MCAYLLGGCRSPQHGRRYQTSRLNSMMRFNTLFFDFRLAPPLSLVVYDFVTSLHKTCRIPTQYGWTCWEDQFRRRWYQYLTTVGPNPSTPPKKGTLHKGKRRVQIDIFGGKRRSRSSPPKYQTRERRRVNQRRGDASFSFFFSFSILFPFWVDPTTAPWHSEILC